MLNKDRSLYISDLDGTLLNSGANLSSFSSKHLKILLEYGIKFTVASARSIVSIQDIFKGIEIELPVIEFNGAFISDLKTGKHITVNSINKKVYRSIISENHNNVVNCIISSFDGESDNLYYDKLTNPGDTWYINDRIENRDKRLKKVNSILDVNDEHIVCITMIDSYEKLFDIYNSLKGNCEIELHLQENMYSPGWYWLTIHSSKATKDQAIRELVKIYGLEGYNLTVFGDNSNDIKMLEIADNSIAVNNAIKDLKDIADKVVLSNLNDGVVKYILENEGIVVGI